MAWRITRLFRFFRWISWRQQQLVFDSHLNSQLSGSYDSSMGGLVHRVSQETLTAYENKLHPRPTDRREFLLRMSATAAISAVGSRFCHVADPLVGAAGVPLRTIALGKIRISGLVAGWNPIGGHSRSTLGMARAMRKWFTVEYPMPTSGIARGSEQCARTTQFAKKRFIDSHRSFFVQADSHDRAG
jgi:hypothetical protein